MEDTNHFCVIGIGASAGGLEALQEFFSNLGKVSDLAFVVVQHLSPDYKSLMPELLARHTSLPVSHIQDGGVLTPGNVYILPPKHNVTVFKRQLFLTPPEAHLNLPIDIFLNSLADEYGEHAIGVIFSGTGTDGTRGVRAVKEHGGFVVVQSAESATFDGMPRSAIATGLADMVLSPAEIATELPIITQNLLTRSIDAPKLVSSSKHLAKILSLVKIKTRLDFSYYKESTIIRRIERRISLCKCASLEEYLTYFETHPEEIETLQREFLIGVTRFFRDTAAYKNIKEKALPEIINSKGSNDQIRVWVAGCSTGEEAYSLAILFDELFEEAGIKQDLKIFATDIDRNALETAARGIYPLSIAADASFERLGKYFFKNGDGYQIQPHIRKQIVFAYHNLAQDPPFPRIDLVSCRNLLIYLQPVLQKKVLNNFRFSLNEGGFLFLGSSETVGELSNIFSMVSTTWKIFRLSMADPKTLHKLSVPYPLISNIPEVILTPADSRQEHCELLLTRLMESCMPPTVLVDQDRKVLHFFGEIGDYLQIKAGRPDLDILKLARGNLSLPLGSLLKSVINRSSPLESTAASFRLKGEVIPVEITARTILTATNHSNYAITFTRTSQPYPELPEFDLEQGVKNHIEDLENELNITKENLQATIEELETSNEELQATNEELLAANEELQSTNEELQSVNEELVTVNSEYQNKIQELTELTEDMEHLMKITNVGVVFLDEALRIRRYTYAASKPFKIIPSDIGRNINDLRHRLDLPNLADDLRSVLTGASSLSREVTDNQGNWFEMQIVPFKGKDTRQTGVLLSLIGINRFKQVEGDLKRKHDLLYSLMEETPLATTVVDCDGQLTFANRGARELLGLIENATGELVFEDKKFKISDLDGKTIPAPKRPFMLIKKSGKPIHDYRHKIHRNNEDLTLNITGCPVLDQDGNVVGAVFTMEKVTDCK